MRFREMRVGGSLGSLRGWVPRGGGGEGGEAVGSSAAGVVVGAGGGGGDAAGATWGGPAGRRWGGAMARGGLRGAWARWGWVGGAWMSFWAPAKSEGVTWGPAGGAVPKAGGAPGVEVVVGA